MVLVSSKSWPITHLATQFYNYAIDFSTDPKHLPWITPLLIVADASLCALIIWKIPYTEIDWKSYMQQVAQYISGERDYVLIKGDTGSLVYPAAHLYVYSALYYITDQGRNIELAQYMFGGLYLAVLSVVMACYRLASAPPYLFPLLILSKRLHSIFVLRLFNDCFAIAALWIAIYAYQKRIWTIGNIAYSWALGTKMSVLLALPAVGIILFQALPFDRALRSAALMAQVQITLAFPFLASNPTGYLLRSFDITRRFLFRWTVNWRFIGEETFLSREFSITLIIAHASLLALFLTTRWTQPSGLSLPSLARTLLQPLPPQVKHQTSLLVTPSFILTTILTAIVIGMLCARSLHYQFYSYVAWTTPFLLWKTGMHPILIYCVWAVQEWAWNVYPSTNTSSSVVVACLAMQVLGVWWGSRNDSLRHSGRWKPVITAKRSTTQK